MYLITFFIQQLKLQVKRRVNISFFDYWEEKALSTDVLLTIVDEFIVITKMLSSTTNLLV